MPTPAERVTDAELEILRVLWASTGPMTAAEIKAALSDHNPDTTKTLLRRLCQKRAVFQQKREVFVYLPLVGPGELARCRTRRLIDSLYGGSAKAMVASMAQNDLLRREDIEELRRMFDKETASRSFEEWSQAFCKRKYNSDFSVEMSRSVRQYLESYL